MKTALIVLFVAAVTIPLAAQETPDIEKEFARALLAEKEGRREAAVDAWRRFIGIFPDAGEHTRKAYAHLTMNLAALGKTEEARRVIEVVLDRYGEDEAMVEWARRAKADLNIRAARDAMRSFDEEKDELGRRLEELERIWKRAGLDQKEIEARIERARAEFERAMANKAKLEEELKRLRADGVEGEELRRRMEEIHKDLTEAEESRWRKRHDRGMKDAMREFLHLAERLGIPPEEAERLIEKYHRPGPGRHFEPAPARAVEHLERRVNELEERVRRLEERVR
jgi:DNA repair exonuclease SbcCD ATPase subunit